MISRLTEAMIAQREKEVITMSETGLILDMTLVRPAQGRGGDRYECQLASEPKPIVLYFPQSITRTAHNQPIKKLKVVVSEGD